MSGYSFISAMEELKFLQKEVVLLREEAHEYEQLTGRMSYLLTATADALKGEPLPLHLHDWSDLPEVAKTIRSALQETQKVIQRSGLYEGELTEQNRILAMIESVLEGE